MRILLIILLLCLPLHAQYLLIPMDEAQTDHLKAYGIAYWVLKQEVNVEWLLNYRGGSFLFTSSPAFIAECQLRGVLIESISAAVVNQIYAQIEESNMEKILLEKAPKIAVYSPPVFNPGMMQLRWQ